MFKKNILGLILFACLITTGLFFGAGLLIKQEANTNKNHNTSYTTDAKKDTQNNTTDKKAGNEEEQPWLSANPSDRGDSLVKDNKKKTIDSIPSLTAEAQAATIGEKNTKEAISVPDLKLIIDSSKVDYMSYIPKMVIDSELKSALNIDNPKLHVDAKAAILFDADTKQVLYHKNAVTARFSASTAKLLTTLVALDWCKPNEKITIGDEITMIASDSTRAYLKVGEKVRLKNLIEGMLLPSGNDAAYATAAYVGRKSLEDKNASKKDAIKEFARLMNIKAQELGAKNSCFKSPDGYDAIGQYTTAYDMGMIGIEAAKNKTILSVTKKASSRNIFLSGQDVTWTNTDKLISRYSGEYYPYAIGLKTGTSTMAGRCLIGAARKKGKKVVCVVMNSTSTGRWEDAITLLKYGLNN